MSARPGQENEQSACAAPAESLTSPNWGGDGLYFLPYQRRWLADKSPLKIIEKSRQIGFTSATAFSAVRRTAVQDARLDVFVSSRDEMQARLFLEDARRWAGALNIGALEFGEELLPERARGGAGVLELSNGRRIYSLASTPNALAGKRGHVILDEFALHANQRELFRVAKPVTTWGGQLEIISTHRGTKSVFNEIIRDITEQGNPMGWSHHKVTLQDAVNEGLVERLNEKTARIESAEEFMRRTRAECLDEAQWQEEFCCQPADETTAFLSYDMVAACVAECLRPGAYLERCPNPLFLGMDTGRKHDLTVIDVGEQVGDVIWDRLRLELANKTFAEQEFELFRILALPGLRRACIDATGLGMQLAERARQRFGWKVEPVTFTAAAKEEMAYALRTAFEDRRVRIPSDNKLIADLLGIKREVTSSGSLRFAGESGDSHCDRFWAKALRQHAAASSRGIQATVG